MSTYTEHNDRKGRDSRLRVEAWRDARGRMLATFREMDFGAVTLYVSKADLKRRLAEALALPKYDVQMRTREAARMKVGGVQS